MLSLAGTQRALHRRVPVRGEGGVRGGRERAADLPMPGGALRSGWSLSLAETAR